MLNKTYIILILTGHLLPYGLPNGVTSSGLQLDRIQKIYLELCPYPLSTNLVDEYGMLTEYSKPLQIDVLFVISRLVNIDDLQKKLSLFGELTLTWYYPCSVDCEQLLARENLRLCNSSYFKGIKFYQPKQETWYPMLLQLNGYEKAAPLEDLFNSVKIHPRSNYASLAAIGTFDTACDSFSFTRFPFDTLNCDIIFYNIDKPALVHFNIKRFEGQKDMRLVAATDTWEHIPEYTWNVTTFPFIDSFTDTKLVFSIKFRRKYQYYVCSFLLPAIGLTILQITGLIMPPNMPDRASFEMTVVLAYMVLLSMIFNQIPQTPEPVYCVYMIIAKFVAGILLTVYSLVTCELSDVGRKCDKKDTAPIFSQKRVRILDICVGSFFIVAIIIVDAVLFTWMMT